MNIGHNVREEDIPGNTSSSFSSHNQHPSPTTVASVPAHPSFFTAPFPGVAGNSPLLYLQV